MGRGGGVVEKEGVVGWGLAQKREGFLLAAVGGVVSAAEGAAIVAFERFFSGVAPEVGGVVVVGLPLGNQAVEEVEALPERSAFVGGVPEAPLADAGGAVADRLEALGDGDFAGGEGQLGEVAVGFADAGALGGLARSALGIFAHEAVPAVTAG